MIYKLLRGENSPICGITIVGVGIYIPIYMDNTDFAQFKIQIVDGTPLQDPDGNVMTQEQVDEFLKTIP